MNIPFDPEIQHTEGKSKKALWAKMNKQNGHGHCTGFCNNFTLEAT